jgi:DNA-binding transcriptional LysR family regulator
MPSAMTKAEAADSMRFDLVDLQLFVAVAETRSITGGAGRVHLALASASERVKGLEAALGVPLLKRGRRGVELTSAGESLLDHARIVLHNVDALRGDLASFASGVRASVQLLANTSTISEYLPKTLAAFLADHPRISIDVEERESGEIARAIASGAADLGLAAEHALPEGIERIPFSEDRLVLVVPRGDELAGRRQVDFRDVVSRDFVGLITSSALHAHVSGHAGDRRTALRALDEDCRGQDQGLLGGPAARHLRPQLQGVAQAGPATGRAFEEGGALIPADRAQLLSILNAASCTRGSPAATIRPPFCAGLPSQVVTTPPAPVMIGISAAIS